MKKLLTRIHRALRPSRGQMMVLFVVIFSITLVAGVITVDVGWWLSDARAATKAADLAALAGSQSLLRHAGRTDLDPDGQAWWKTDEKAAISDACEWAKRNGYEDGVNGVVVKAQLFCKNTDSRLDGAGICLSGGPRQCSIVNECASVLGGRLNVRTPGCDSITVTISKPAGYIFASTFGLPGKSVVRGTAAGLLIDVVPLHAVMAIDRTGSMVGNPLTQAKAAAKKFTDYLLAPATGSSQTLVGMAPYNDCYNPPRTLSRCTPASGSSSMVIGLTNNATQVNNTINRLTADGSTNICLGVDKANTLLLAVPPSDPNTKQAVVLLSDGQNWYTSDAYSQSQGAPPSQCRPSDPTHSDDHTGENPHNSACYDAQPNQRSLDSKTNTLVNGPGGLKARGIDVYVVGFGVCGTPNSNLCNTSIIGTNTHDNTANRNLLKCLASSAPGTNDHYYEVPNATDLPNIFQAIAWAISGRSITQ